MQMEVEFTIYITKDLNQKLQVIMTLIDTKNVVGNLKIW